MYAQPEARFVNSSPAFFALHSGVLLAVLFLVIVLPDGFATFGLTAIVLAIISVVSFARPAFLIYFAIFTGGVSAILRALDTVTVGGVTISLSGLRWLCVAAVALVLVIWNVKRVSVNGGYLLLLAFSVWAAIRWVQTEVPIGLRDVLFYLLPVILSLLATVVAQTHGERFRKLVETLTIWSALLPLAIFVLLLPFGLMTLTERGPEGLLDPRTLAETLATAVCIALAQWRYGESAQQRSHGLWISACLFVATVLTLSRASIAVLLLLGCMSSFRAVNARKVVAGMLIATMVAVLIFVFIPPLRHRFFVGGDEGVFSDEFPYINLEGRGLFWAVTAIDSLNSPLVGLGPGSARLVVAAALPRNMDFEEYHPHNEFLQVFHDTGVVGLLLVCGGWVWLLVAHWRGLKRATSSAAHNSAKWHMAAFLGCAMVLLHASIGNTFHETFTVAPVLIMSACAFGIIAKPSSGAQIVEGGA